MNQRIVKILLADVTAIQVMLGTCSILFSFGWWFADSTGGAYDGMLRHAPAWIWGAGFLFYGLTKYTLAFRCRSRYVIYAVLLLGTYLWLFTILSFADNPVRRMGSADVMLTFLVVGEVWVGASTLARTEDDQPG